MSNPFREIYIKHEWKLKPVNNCGIWSVIDNDGKNCVGLNFIGPDTPSKIVEEHNKAVYAAMKDLENYVCDVV